MVAKKKPAHVAVTAPAKPAGPQYDVHCTDAKGNRDVVQVYAASGDEAAAKASKDRDVTVRGVFQTGSE